LPIAVKDDAAVVVESKDNDVNPLLLKAELPILVTKLGTSMLTKFLH
jgi:hypothetical protein